MDPNATGVLVVLIGKATKLQSNFLNCDKSYEGVIRLGESRNTDDVEGEVVNKCEDGWFEDWEDKKEKFFELIKKEFSGKIPQTPPIFSAIHVNCQRSYKLARAGKDVKLKPREVEVLFHDLKEVRGDGGFERELYFRVRCSKGTYIRSLARDIGELLGCYGYLDSLRRLSSGDFEIEESYTLDTVLESSNLNEFLIPIERFLP